MYFLEPNVLSLALLAGTSAIAHDVSFRQVARQQPLGLFAPLATSFRIGEGFRMPAIAGGPCEDGPAYGNRPSTNPRGAGARLWGFEDSAATV
jgi:hypothetical protein